jgi:NADH-quinone oxidoreductase subunit E
VKGSMLLAEKLYSKLKLSPKKPTSDDMLFTIETVSCLGACGLAPVMVINEEVYGQVKNDRLNEIIDNILAMEGGTL